MADIDIEKDKSNKSSGKIWLWVLGILLLAGIIWWIAAGNDTEEYGEVETIEQGMSQNNMIKPFGEDTWFIRSLSTV